MLNNSIICIKKISQTPTPQIYIKNVAKDNKLRKIKDVAPRQNNLLCKCVLHIQNTGTSHFDMKIIRGYMKREMTRNINKSTTYFKTYHNIHTQNTANVNITRPHNTQYMISGTCHGL